MTRVMTEATAPKQSSMHAWSFSRPEPFGMAMLQLATGPASEGDFRQFAQGMRSRFVNPAVAAVVFDSLTWTPVQRDLRVTVRHTQSGGFVVLRCVPSAPTQRREYIICAMGMAMDTTSLRHFTDGLSATNPSR